MSIEVYTCSACGFAHDLALASVGRVGPAVVAGVADAVDVLRGAGAAVRQRPEPSVWSPLEYACHLRDVLLIQRERVLRARRVDRPTFEAMGRDERVELDGYADQDPEDVARQLADAAAMFANDLDRLAASDWDRTGIYPYPSAEERSLRWVAVHTLHEVRHHSLDIGGQIGGTDR